jgi:hypothetical protein
MGFEPATWALKVRSMAGLRHPDRGWISSIVLGQKAVGVFTARLPISPRVAFDTTDGTRTRKPCGTIPEVSPTYGTQYKNFVSRRGNRRPASWYGPTNLHSPCLAAALRESNPRPFQLGAKEGPATAPTWKRVTKALSEHSGQRAAGASTTAEAAEGESNPISLINSQLSTSEVTPAYGT